MASPREFVEIVAAQAWIDQEFERRPERPEAEHLAALREYKGVGYHAINDALRNGSKLRFDEPLYRAVTEAIASEALDEAVVTFRGVEDAGVATAVLLGAAEIPHVGYVSVSLMRSVAERFLSRSEARNEEDVKNVLMIGALRVGTSAAPLDLLGINNDEAELLLHAGSTFVVEGADVSDLDMIEVRGYWTSP